MAEVHYLKLSWPAVGRSAIGVALKVQAAEQNQGQLHAWQRLL